jgi:hypothetical protein
MLREIRFVERLVHAVLPLILTAIFSAAGTKVHDSGELFAGIMIPYI